MKFSFLFFNVNILHTIFFSHGWYGVVGGGGGGIIDRETNLLEGYIMVVGTKTTYFLLLG